MEALRSSLQGSTMSEAGSESHVVHASLTVSLEVPLSGVSLIRRTLVNERSKHAPATTDSRSKTTIYESAKSRPDGRLFAFVPSMCPFRARTVHCGFQKSIEMNANLKGASAAMSAVRRLRLYV